MDDITSEFDDLAVPWWCLALGVFTARSILILFVFSMLTCLSVLQKSQFCTESVLGLEVSIFCLLEVDDVPDGVKVLSDQVSNESRGGSRSYIRLDVLVLEVEGLPET